MTYVMGPLLPIPATPPQPPQLTLIGSSVNPSNATDPATLPNGPTPALLAKLSAALKSELAQHKAEDWVRGITYAPENHFGVEVRDPQDFTSVDLPALPAPTGLVATPHITGGTLAAATYSYQVTAVNANGETTALAAVTGIVASGTTGSVSLAWQPTADGVTYKIYGRVSGSIGLLATVGPFDPDNPPAYVDAGTPAPGAAPPGSNTTGGAAASRVNLGTVQCQPFLIVAEDYCSTFGFEARDFKGRALRLLDNGQHYALENEFWTGTLAQAKGYPNNYLANGSAANFVDLTAGTPVSVARGQQLLQDYLASTGFGGQGMIHCQPQTAPNLLNARRVGKLLLDVFDNIIVPGSGYTGAATAVTGSATGTAAMFATDLVSTLVEGEGKVGLVSEDGNVYPDSFAEAVDRGEAGFPNNVRFRAIKYGCAFFDGFIQAGVRVNLAT